ncbi:MAG: hypothetical protein JW918_00445 [Anaerolineae bacterium]|nr:hypothetical protein [Anaerolineae bacterium]
MNSPTNPYIAGNPITGSEMFFGRQDVFCFVRETLVGRYQDNAIVLYGGRRTGKTSVLYQMGRHLDPKYVPVFVDLQAVSLGGLGEMLWGIARQAVRVLRQQKGIKLSIPSREEFARDPEGCFYERFLDPALEALGDGHLLLMLDEAARLYEQVHAGRLEPRAFDFLRSLIQYHSRLNFIFSIGSGLEEMRREYALLFNLCQYRKISFLDRDAAVALITKPVEEHYRYAPGAVDRILDETCGHPYYTQLVCNRLFARWARHDGDEVTPADVEAVLGEAVEQGMASLQYTWEEASDAAKVVLAALTELMKDSNGSVSLSDLEDVLAAEEIALSRRAVGRALQELVVREVLYSTREGYAFTLDLMRLWVKQYQHLEWVKGQVALPVEVSAPAKRDWVRVTLAGVSAGLLFLMVGLSIIVWRSIERDRTERQASATAMYGTIEALRTRVAQVPSGALEQAELSTEIALKETEVVGVATALPTQEPPITPTAVPLPTYTSTPIPTPTPSPTPECLPGDGPFVDIWEADQGALGCARDVSQAVEGAKQAFEGGMMIWRGETDQIIVLYSNSEWALYDGTWKEGDPYIHPDCESMIPPTTSLYLPVRSFGKLWCTNEPARERLDWATEKEREWAGMVQEFQGGLTMMLAYDDTVEAFIFYCEDKTCTGGKWRPPSMQIQR